MIRINEIKLSLDDDEGSLKSKAAKILKVREDDITYFEIIKKSLDARKKDSVFFSYSVDVKIKDEIIGESKLVASLKLKNVRTQEPFHYEFKRVNKAPDKKIFVVGFGPAGMFAALTLARAGLCPIVLERGECVEKRQKAVNEFWTSAKLREDTNVQFGEGGAGTFSDGKLNTGTKDMRRSVVLKTFYEHGAPEEILYLSKPHIGTDNLPKAVKGIREEIKSLGGQVLFGCKMTGIIRESGKITGILYTDESGEKIACETENIIIAIGHSARDTFRMLFSENICFERKIFAIGARIEHLQKNINLAQYGKFAQHKNIPTADYKLASHFENDRSAYTFCMCPGGEVVGAASNKGGVVVNGMSNFLRNGENANSALLVNILPEDFEGNNPLAAIDFQEKIERSSYKTAGENYKAPAQLVGDFLKSKPSSSLGNVNPTYRPGVTLCDICECLPKAVTDVMKKAIIDMDKRLSGFAAHDAVLTAPETRSSSPVRILRNELFESVSARGLYPCGEGAGYAGGIMSSAVDGIRCAEAVISKYMNSCE